VDYGVVDAILGTEKPEDKKDSKTEG
jgi:hypothetical protein